MTTVQQIETLTGVKPGTVDEVWKEVKANKAKLDGCQKPHDFSICLDRRTKEIIVNPTVAQRFAAYWRCSKCGGQRSTIDKLHYEEGLKDAKI
jgi:hypothetical protein